MSGWPAWATEAIEIADADPAWPARAAALIAGLEARLAPWLRGGVHHVGSTAVPGLAAKPILDLMAGVAALDSPAVAALVGAGWHLVPPELDARPWRRLLVEVTGGRRSAHLHLMIAGSDRWLEQLRFRDRLRASPGLRAEYAALKRRLAGQHRGDREAYSRAKAAFVARHSAPRSGG